VARLNPRCWQASIARRVGSGQWAVGSGHWALGTGTHLFVTALTDESWLRLAACRCLCKHSAAYQTFCSLVLRAEYWIEACKAEAARLPSWVVGAGVGRPCGCVQHTATLLAVTSPSPPSMQIQLRLSLGRFRTSHALPDRVDGVAPEHHGQIDE
jgi:hypothetical protein